MQKKGDIMGLPFSVIFSIILIIFFIITAIIAIKVFWNPSACAFVDQSQEALYKQNLQQAIDGAWQGDRSDSEFKQALPGKITYVCFLDLAKKDKGNFASFFEDLELYSEGKNNFYFYPGKMACEGFRGMTLSHINITEITKTDNPYCVKSDKALTIEKGFYDALVKIK